MDDVLRYLRRKERADAYPFNIEGGRHRRRLHLPHGVERARMIRIETSARTDVGLRRTSNEDAFVSDAEPGILALADGMGGAASGEVASGIFVDTVRDRLSAGPTPLPEEAEEFVRQTFLLANRRIRDLAAREPKHQG